MSSVLNSYRIVKGLGFRFVKACAYLLSILGQVTGLIDKRSGVSQSFEQSSREGHRGKDTRKRGLRLRKPEIGFLLVRGRLRRVKVAESNLSVLQVHERR